MKDSLEFDDFVVDFFDSEIVGLEIMNASQVLTRYIQGKSRPEIKKMLTHIVSARMATEAKDKMVFIVASISFKRGEASAPVPVAINLPKQVILART